jgi:hypothetical protein
VVKNGGAIPPLPHMSLWNNAQLIKNRVNCIFVIYIYIYIFFLLSSCIAHREGCFTRVSCTEPVNKIISAILCRNVEAISVILCRSVDVISAIQCRNVKVISTILYRNVSRDSVVCIATGYGLDDRGLGLRVPLGSRLFCPSRRPDWLWSPPNLLSNGYRGFFLRV